MFDLILGLLLIALLAGALGARKTSAVASNIAWAIFVVVLVVWVLSLLF